MKGETIKTLTPRLRFPEFRDKPGWDCSTIGEVATLLKGKGLSKADLDPHGKRPCIRYAELYTRYGEVIDAVHSRTSAPDDDLLLSNINDVIIPASGETKADIATASCVLRAGIALGSDLNVLRTLHDGVFLSYYINGTLRPVIAKVAQGDTVVHLYPSQLKQTALAVPSPAEQRKIAACLGSLDEWIGAEAAKLEALRSHKKGLMQQLFPRPGESRPRLRFPEFHNAGDWEEKKLDDLAKRRTGHTPNKATPEYYNGGIKWVSLADSKRLDNGLIHETAIEISQEGIENSSAVLHPAGSVILSRDAGVGKSAVTALSMAVSQHFIVWICESSKLSNWFLYYVLQKLKPLFEQIATGSTIKTIGMPFFNAMRIIVPSLAEQQRIAACLSSLDAVLAAQAQKVESLKTHKKALMQQLFPSAEGQA